VKTSTLSQIIKGSANKFPNQSAIFGILIIIITASFAGTAATFFKHFSNSDFDYIVFAQSSAATSGNANGNTNTNNNQPNINAENLFNTKTMTIGNNVKTLVILIPNEGHHGPNEEKESRLIDQQFVPDNAVVSTDTTVAWFNGDVGHERKVDVKDANGASNLFTTGEITDMQLSPTYMFTKPGLYNYEAEGDPGVTMRGTITVVNNLASPVINSQGSSAIDTVGVLMVPTQDIDTYVQDIQNAGLTIDSRYDFKDLRGGQKGTGDVQTLIVWTSAGKDLNSIIPPISELSSSLPYS